MKSSVGPCGKNTDHDLFVHKAKLSQSARFVGEIDLLSDMLETICWFGISEQDFFTLSIWLRPIEHAFVSVCLSLSLCLSAFVSVCLSVWMDGWMDGLMDGGWSESADTEDNCNLQTFVCS